MSHSDQRHLIYHLYPRKGGLWDLNVDLIAPRLQLFNGRKVVCVAVDETTEDLDVVMARFRDLSVTFIPRANDELHETGSFIDVLMPAVAAEEGVTFYAHGKGTSYGRRNVPFALNWVRNMVHYNLQPDAPRYLDELYESVGIYRRLMFHNGSPWHYSGTFFWFRNEAVFRRADRDWGSITRNTHGVEAYIGRLIPYNVSYSLYGDNAPNLYINYC